MAALVFSQARDVDESHAGLYRGAIDHVIWERRTMYQICGVCGYVADGGSPDNCPVCGADRPQFQSVD